MTRLDTQRIPSRLHVRKNARWYARGYDDSLHEVWGDSLTSGSSPKPAVSTAYAGIPGSWGPEGAALPATAAAAIAANPTAVPATPWTTGQFVQTATAGAAGRICWTGTDWVTGAAP